MYIYIYIYIYHNSMCIYIYNMPPRRASQRRHADRAGSGASGRPGEEKKHHI